MANSFAERDGKPLRIVAGAASASAWPWTSSARTARARWSCPSSTTPSSLTFDEFVARYDELVVGARDNTLPPDAYQGANITLTNPGGIGTVASVPRLMPGQGTIIAAGAIGYPPGLAQADAGKGAGVSKVMTMTSTYDHRVIQGAESGAVPEDDRRAAPGRGRLLRGDLRRARLDRRRRPTTARRRRRRQPSPPPSRLPAARPARGRRGAGRGAAAGGAGRDLGGQGVPHARPPGRATSTRSAREPPGDPALDPETVEPDAGADGADPGAVLRIAVEGETFADALPHLQETYCGTIAYEIEHISDHEQRVWLRQAIESGAHRQPLDADEKRRAARAAVGGRGARELPAQGVPRQEAVLDRGPRRARADARRGDRDGAPTRARARS